MCRTGVGNIESELFTTTGSLFYLLNSILVEQHGTYPLKVTILTPPDNEAGDCCLSQCYPFCGKHA